MDTQDSKGTFARRATVVLGGILLVAGVCMAGISTYSLFTNLGIRPRDPLVGVAMAAGGYFYCHRGERSRLFGTLLMVSALLLWKFTE
jgi:hypothetical protein